MVHYNQTNPYIARRYYRGIGYTIVIEAIWEEFLKIVSQEVGVHIVQTWLKAVKLSHWDALERVAYLQAPNAFVQEWIKSHYLVLFEQHLGRLFNVNALKIIFLDKEKSTIITKEMFIPAIQTESISTKKDIVVKRLPRRQETINKNYVFGNFVVGPSNQLAYAAAYAITEKVGCLYNPLFIYGDSGLGKTHLLHAIGNQIEQQCKKIEILYQTADRFVNEFISAIRFDKVAQFKAKYQELDVLLIDDVQFMSKKEQTQEVFFHIFNMLYEAQKQIVFSSDSEPAGIQGLADRLRTRFGWGLVTDIQIPTIETKIAILKHKADLLDQAVPDEVIDYIAHHVNSNIRELEGALIRITAFSALVNQPISFELAKKVLAKKEKQQEVSSVDRIIDVIQKYYQCTINDLRSESRSKQLSLARQVAMYFMKKLTNKSLQEIGLFLGRKDHSTVIYALNKIEKDSVLSSPFKKQLLHMEKDILGSA